MTEEELGAVKDMHGNAMNVWYDRMFEDYSVAQLVEELLRCMPAGDLLEDVYKIEKDIAESLEEEGDRDD